MATATKQSFEVHVSTSNVAHIVVEADSAEDAEKMVSEWIKQGDPRFFLHYTASSDGDFFDPENLDVDEL